MPGHLREVFPIVQNLSTGAGEVAHTAVAGEVVAGKNGIEAFAFKSHDGKFVLPTLTSEGRLPVDFEGAGIPKHGSSDGEVAGASSLTTIAEIALTVGKTYGKIKAQGSCFKETLFYLIQQDDATETKIGHGVVGPGNYNCEIDLGVAEKTAGASGTQKFILKAMNLHGESDFLGHLSCLELINT